MYLNVPQYTSMYLNVPQYTSMYLNVPHCTSLYLTVLQDTSVYKNSPSTQTDIICSLTVNREACQTVTERSSVRSVIVKCDLTIMIDI